jgi:hypothetical protein
LSFALLYRNLMAPCQIWCEGWFRRIFRLRLMARSGPVLAGDQGTIPSRGSGTLLVSLAIESSNLSGVSNDESTGIGAQAEAVRG